MVFSIDEKCQTQALDRTQPGLPMKKGRCGTMTHDYKRNGTITLFAALNILTGKVIGRCMPKHRHQDYIRFLDAVDTSVPTGKTIHAIADNYATHKHPKVQEWLEAHPRWTFHFTPTSASWPACSPNSAQLKCDSPASSLTSSCRQVTFVLLSSVIEMLYYQASDGKIPFELLFTTSDTAAQPTSQSH